MTNRFCEFQQVHYCYPRQEKPIIAHLSFSVKEGEFLGILGADDSGKTTLAKLFKGFLLPTQGHIYFTLPHDSLTLSASSRTEELYTLRRSVGAIFSDPENQIVGTTVEEDMAFGLENLQVEHREMRMRVERTLEQFGLSQYAEREPHTLSGGEQQKLCIAGVLAMEPECLVFDEPLSFLDRQSRNELLDIFQSLHASGKTLIYLTSDPEELMNTDRILILQNGTLSGEYSPTDLWENLDILEQAGIYPPDMMRFRAVLQQRGVPLAKNTLTPEALACEILRYCHNTTTD
ncbi:hypothetical protein CSA56_09370 [candidate division KSB3 bacterium]|uniref:ABC transporter domain-containing protein n=1 Tax=candidate division KSB3 bacterium TaxID=2044937 RepID=A0A2G6KDY0_9BACT|nr:MAG: hypothetical protein CSA56_09370 [candidate division KSB3 bacterium]